MTEEAAASRLARIETVQTQQGHVLERTARAVESIAVISERMANHIEDTKRMHQRLDDCENDIAGLQTKMAETYGFYKDIKTGILGLLGVMASAIGGLILFLLERKG